MNSTRKSLNILVPFLLFVLLFINCDYKQVKRKEHTSQIKITGNFVTSDYEKRNEGYDWVGVNIFEVSDSIINVKIRSRADRKKPTCTLDTKAFKISEGIFHSIIDNSTIVFSFKNDTLSIKTLKKENANTLYFFCSGGASLEGVYHRISEELDRSQIDNTNYFNNLIYNDVGFTISTKGFGSIQELFVEPYGLEIVNRKESISIDGTVVNSEIGDLNFDGFPEVLIYTSSAGSGTYGSVVGFSVNNGKSMSRIYFPDISKNEKANIGYMGHDEFAIVESTLVQRFPIYKPGDSNANPTGGIRQIQYKLIDGEASRRFVIDKTIEY